MGRLFGTDGVRGVVNEDLSCELAFKIGQAGASVLGSEVHTPRIIVGRDTRVSGEMLEAVLNAGICSVGGEVLQAGIIPTPGLAYLVRQYGADAAVMISASHNSFEFNGIKWFNCDGFKLSDEVEDKIEAIVLNEKTKLKLAVGEEVGRLVKAHNSSEDYRSYLKNNTPGDFKGFKIVLDCANGAASTVAPKLFRSLGAEVTCLFHTPDGVNINAKCGSTHPQRLQQAVLEIGADIGIAFDGDADRMIAVDEYGVVVDGDRIMAICAVDLYERQELAKNTLVTTVMSNLGMKIFMENAGINVVTTKVGDRYVLECMLEHGYNFGGEQSGHFIFLEKNTTGDGMLSALELLNVIKRRGESLASLARPVEIFPQVLVNIQIQNEYKEAYKQDEQILERIAQTEELLSSEGRVLVRASGTEPLIRVMIEGRDNEQIQGEALEIARLFAKKYKGKIKA